MNKLITEAISAVSELNEEFLKRNQDNHPYFTPYELIVADEQSLCIKYMGVAIWHSDTDWREFDEEAESYEPLKYFLLKETLKIQKLLFPSVGIVREFNAQEYPKVKVSKGSTYKVVLFTRENHGIIIDHFDENLRGFECSHNESEFISIEEIVKMANNG